MPQKKSFCAHPLFALRLELKNFKQFTVLAGDKHFAVRYGNFSRCAAFKLGFFGRMKLDILAALNGGCGGPRRETSYLIMHFINRFSKINRAKSLCKHRRITALIIVLLYGFKAVVKQSSDCF